MNERASPPELDKFHLRQLGDLGRVERASPGKEGAERLSWGAAVGTDFDPLGAGRRAVVGASTAGSGESPPGGTSPAEPRGRRSTSASPRGSVRRRAEADRTIEGAFTSADVAAGRSALHEPAVLAALGVGDDERVDRG